MARNAVRAVALCEDERHRSFLLALFDRLGVQPIRTVAAPKGVNGEQWVRIQLMAEARKFRSQAPHQANLVLVVMTDGDRFGFIGRKRQLDDALVEKGYAPRGTTERILYLVPTWSIETWLGWLCDAHSALPGLSESQSYKGHSAFERLYENGQISVRLSVDRWEPVASHEAIRIPSLADARIEIARIP